ncbi:peroxiredoxin family protein [Streptomyces altiplanensis]
MSVLGRAHRPVLRPQWSSRIFRATSGSWRERIPSAAGESSQDCRTAAGSDNLDALRAEGVDRVLALSSDRADCQQALVDRLHLSYPMLSDPDSRSQTR